MNAADTLALYDAEMRMDPPENGVQIQKSPGLTVCINTLPGLHGGWVLYTRLTDENADETIRAHVESFIQAGRDWEWKVCDHDTPPDLKERLRAHGLQPQESEALAALDLEEAPARLWQPVSVDIRRITTPAGIDEAMQIEEQVWEESQHDLGEELKRGLASHADQLSVYVAYVDGQPASAAWIRYYPGKQFADLWGGSTLAQFRGRGLYAALVAVRAQEARARSVRFLTVDASPMSRPILEKLGFRVLTYSQPFIWKAKG